MTTPISTPTQEIAIQNQEYRESLEKDIQLRNKQIIELMDTTVALREKEESEARLQAMNSLSRRDRSRLMAGEKIEDILPLDILESSKYYNTSEEAANSISSDRFFLYQIGEHLMAYETSDVSLSEQLKTISLPVVIYNPAEDDYEERIYTIHDKETFDILKHQLIPNHNTVVVSVSSDESSSDSHVNRNSTDLTVPFHYEQDIDFRSYDSSPDPFEHEEMDYNYNRNHTYKKDVTNDRIRKIQDKLFEQLMSIYGYETSYSQEVYTNQMKIRIQRMLDRNRMPFQIVNDIIMEFVR